MDMLEALLLRLGRGEGYALFLPEFEIPSKDDFIPGRQGALWMTSSMVARIGTGIASGC
jgi:hypothetical protein